MVYVIVIGNGLYGSGAVHYIKNRWYVELELIITQPNGICGRPLATTIGSEPHTTYKIQGDL